jgi:protein TonB
MKKLFLLVSLFFVTAFGFSQEGVSVKGNTLTVKEIAPVWPGCESAKINSKNCFNQKVAQHIKENYKFPKDKNGELIRGITTVVFYIDEKGEVINVTAEGDKKEINAEAIRIVKLLPKMKPGHKGGTPISVKYKMPFNF